MKEIRISLSEKDFRDLVKGEILHTPEGVAIALQDIGWDHMYEAIIYAETGYQYSFKPGK
jgi:hypothetical protein